MQLKTILNRVQKFKSFVYGAVRWVEGAPVPTLEVEIQPRSNSRPACSGCGQRRPGYDRLPERRFEFIPMWGHKVFFVYAPRRVECPGCGIRVERMPWVAGKHRLTEAYAWFLASWAKRLSWKEVAGAFRTKGRYYHPRRTKAILSGEIFSHVTDWRYSRRERPLSGFNQKMGYDLWHRLVMSNQASFNTAWVVRRLL